MPKPVPQIRPSRDRTLCLALSASLLIFCAVWTFTDPWPGFSSLKPTVSVDTGGAGSGDPTFYDDPGVVYTIDKPMIDWDEKRREWLRQNPAFGKDKNGVLVVTGSQPSSCKNPLGDYLLLRFFKNKVDYCRIHRYQIYYSNAILDPKMRSFWVKIPILRAAMLAHPEVEWLFWVDSDAIFTDMDFKIPFKRYKDHNLVVHGWPEMIYEKKSWVAVNAGVFLIRNCQWSMDFLDVWAGMGPRSPNYENWGKIQRSTLKDKLFPQSDDQSALIYLLLKGNRKWREMIYVENQYALHGYWLGIVGKFDRIAEKYDAQGGRRHAEAVREGYAAAREGDVAGKEWRRPFVTHFTGCQPCSGEHNPEYEGDSCLVGMERAINFADNQVLWNYGFVHPDIGNTSLVSPLPFDFIRGVD